MVGKRLPLCESSAFPDTATEWTLRTRTSLGRSGQYALAQDQTSVRAEMSTIPDLLALEPFPGSLDRVGHLLVPGLASRRRCASSEP